MKKIFLGLDLSMKGTGAYKIILNDDGSKEFDFMGFTEVKKVSSDKVHLTKKEMYDSNYPRFYFVAKKLKEFIGNETDATYYAVVEDYSQGSVHRVFDIAEFIGIVKFELLTMGIDISIKTIPPTTIKKYASGNGLADKMQLHWKYSEEEDSDLKADLSQWEHAVSPRADIVDAYFMASLCMDLVLSTDRMKKFSKVRDNKKSVALFEEPWIKGFTK